VNGIDPDGRLQTKMAQFANDPFGNAGLLNDIYADVKAINDFNAGAFANRDYGTKKAEVDGATKTYIITDNGHVITSPTFTYDSGRGVDLAAVDVLSKIGPISSKENVEYAGEVYSPWFSDEYKYSQPTTLNLPAKSYFGATTPWNSSVAAGFHTHGGNDPGAITEYYSKEDLRTADWNGYPSYMYAPSGNIYKYQKFEGVSKWDPTQKAFVPTGWSKDSNGYFTPNG
jgi:hypothetical protein